MSTKQIETMQPETNGTSQFVNGKFIENIDTEDPEYRRELQRPADVKEDMRQMESRQRVSSILNSQAFREELESIIADQLKHGPHPSSLIALQQISDLLLPNTNSRWQQVSSMMGTKGGNVLIPINDIRGIDTLNYAKGERLLRCKLASLYRIMDLYGWASGISNHISVRLNQELEQYLVNPFGLLYHEVTASSLIKVNSLGTVVEQGSTTYGVNKPAFSLHSAIYKARPDIRCIIHVHTHVVTAVSAMKCGILPLSQEAILCGNISYHDFKGILAEEDIRNFLAQDLGPLNKIMVLKNHGIVACGETIEEACYNQFNIMAACEIQMKAMVAGLDNLNIPSAETQRKLVEMSLAQTESLTLLENKKWKTGELEFEALMRCLDNAGYRTGYMYRQPIMRSIDRNAIKEVEIPPAATSHSYDVEYIRKLKEEKSKVIKGEWLNSPNVYARTETEETGTPNPKKITKWVPESSPSKTSTPIRIENKHHFAPQGTDPKELKNHQKQIKQDRFEDKKSAGYQSKILENIVPNGNNDNEENGVGEQENVELNKEIQSNDQYLTSGMPGGSTIVFGAASKGIIKRDQQNNAVVYKTYYSAANPFQQMDPNELEKYKKEIAQKQMKEQGKNYSQKKKNSKLSIFYLFIK
jgi:adducin